MGLTRLKLKRPRIDALMAQGKGVLSSALALRASAVGISEALFSFRQDIDAWLKNELRGEAVSKIAGACGILDSMLYFQKTTKMSGGDEFVVRFWTVEAARLGLSMQQYSDKCNQSITLYDKFWKALESPK